MNFRKILAALAGWRECSSEDYSEAYELYGGSNCTHPNLLDFLQANTPERYRFYSKKIKGEIKAAIFTNSFGEFCLPGRYNHFMNADEIIFPADKSERFLLPFNSKKISSLHSKNLLIKLPSIFNKRQICLVRTDLSQKTKKNRRNEVNRFLKNGGTISPTTNYSTQEICEIYNDLIIKRWGKKIDDIRLKYIHKFLSENPDMLFGNILEIAGKPCAYDLIIKSESPDWIYFDIPNGGVDPEYNHLSIGSVLMWVNTQQAISLCETQGKEIRFSLGMPTMSYKNRWCKTHHLLRTI